MQRNVAPELKRIEELRINNFKTYPLTNGNILYYTDGLEEDLIKVELRFVAGKWHENHRGQSHATSALMKKGTATKSSLEISDAIEFYGASIDISHGPDFTSVSMHTLGKYMDFIFPVIEEILNDAIFPMQELELYKQRKLQRLQIQSQNTDFHASRKINEVLFGKNHPYGYAIQEQDIQVLEQNYLIDFYKKYFHIGNATIFASGNISASTLEKINQYFGKYKKQSIAVSSIDKSLHTNPEDTFYIEQSDSVQASIRIGSFAPSKTHQDFAGLNVLNTIYGGYFGSRLMSNIREDKGFTYGIHSYISHNQFASYFFIDTEVGNEVCKQAIEEIYHEMHLLQTTLVEKEELEIVQNYMMGTFLRATDGPLNRINVIKNMIMSGLDLSYFNHLTNTIKTITPDELKALANQYFVKNKMKEVVCGNVV